jgi:hypothetical protein
MSHLCRMERRPFVEVAPYLVGCQVADSRSTAWPLPHSVAAHSPALAFVEIAEVHSHTPLADRCLAVAGAPSEIVAAAVADRMAPLLGCLCEAEVAGRETVWVICTFASDSVHDKEYSGTTADMDRAHMERMSVLDRFGQLGFGAGRRVAGERAAAVEELPSVAVAAAAVAVAAAAVAASHSNCQPTTSNSH